MSEVALVQNAECSVSTQGTTENPDTVCDDKIQYEYDEDVAEDVIEETVPSVADPLPV